MKTIVKNADKKSFCELVVLLNGKMKNCFFWVPPSSANDRRSYEEYNSISGKFSLKRNKYEVVLTTKCSAKNIYFHQSIYVNGEKKNITAIKKALAEL